MKHRHPILAWLPRYYSEWLRVDLIAGITLAAHLIPGGLGDSSLANLGQRLDKFHYRHGLCGIGLRQQLVRKLDLAEVVRRRDREAPA